MIDIEHTSPKTITLGAKARVNKPTLNYSNPANVVTKVRTKLAKEILEQLMDSDLIRIASIANPKNGSVTFTATLEVVEQSRDTPTQIAA